MVTSHLTVIHVSVFFFQGYMREGKCHLALGDTMAAERCYKKVLDLETENKTAQEDVSL